AAEPVPEDVVVPLLELGDEPVELAEVVGAVRVAHDDEPAAGRAEPHQVGVAVAARGLLYDPRTGGDGLLDRAVRRAVVGHDHLAAEAGAPDALEGPAHTRAHAALLVEARHDDTDVDDIGAGGARDIDDAVEHVGAHGCASPAGSRWYRLAALTKSL